MSDSSIRTIQTVPCVDVEIDVPPSKSYTNRALIVASLAEGTSILNNPSQADDVKLLISALEKFGVKINCSKNQLEVHGTSGTLQAPAEKIYVGNAGTTMRFLTTFACLAPGTTILYGNEDMHKRPIKDLLDALRSSGIQCSSDNGYPPVTITGSQFKGGKIDIDASISSQYVSSILLSAPYARQPVHLHIKGKLSSMPYVDMSIHVMRYFGAEVEILDESNYYVNNNQRYIAQKFTVEGDASAATYFFAAAAISGGRVIINNLTPESLQGDAKFTKILEEMGCRITQSKENIEVQGSKLKGIEVDMNSMPDCVPMLAVIAAFAQGPTTILNVNQLIYKETDRLKALCNELTRIGAKVERHDDGLTIYPRPLHGAVIETYNDHRIAMSFAIAGLRVDGIAIKNPSCVSKSFPNFWDEFQKLENKK